MDSTPYSLKHLALKDIQKVIDSLGDFAGNVLNSHSLVLVIKGSGETSFTSCGWKLLSEVGFSHPLTKFVNNAALDYSKSCGDDCKYFLFILREMFNAMHNRLNGSDEVFIRRSLINQICLLKQFLPCIFKAVQDASTQSNSGSFSKDLYGLILNFMLSRFSAGVSKILSSLICDFIEKIGSESNSLKLSLEYVISHFDIFCCKILSSLPESKVSKGFFLYKKDIPSDFNIENCKFIVMWDLPMKIKTQDISWKITDESFIPQLNSLYIYQKIFEYFKSQDILLILTASASDNNLKLLCKNNGICILDRLEKEEIECLLTCFHLTALENLNEPLESHHIGKLSFAKVFSSSTSHFLHLDCLNSVRLFDVHHILLSAPCNAMWREYYSECLNCLKMVHQWLKSDANLCFQGRVNEEMLNRSTDKLSMHGLPENCCICNELKINYESGTNIFSFLEPQCSRNLLSPCVWELLFKFVLSKIPENLMLSCTSVIHAMDVAIVKVLCKKTGTPLVKLKDIDSACTEFIKTCKLGDVNFLEPVVCKEIMINNVLDLLLQLLRIESIVFIK